jgi:hypothetical protein
VQNPVKSAIEEGGEERAKIGMEERLAMAPCLQLRAASWAQLLNQQRKFLLLLRDPHLMLLKKLCVSVILIRLKQIDQLRSYKRNSS